MKILDTKSKDDNFQRVIDQYRERVLGKSCVKSSPPEYWEIGLAVELGVPISVWKSYPMWDRSLIMAHQYIKGMISTIDAHYQAQEDNEKKQAEEAKRRRKKKLQRMGINDTDSSSGDFD